MKRAENLLSATKRLLRSCEDGWKQSCKNPTVRNKTHVDIFWIFPYFVFADFFLGILCDVVNNVRNIDVFRYFRRFVVEKTRRGSPVDKKPSTDKLNNFVNIINSYMWLGICDLWYVTFDMWLVICDLWQVTLDMWHTTCDMWHVTDGGRWTFSQNIRSLALTAWEWEGFKDFEETDQGLT